MRALKWIAGGFAGLMALGLFFHATLAPSEPTSRVDQIRMECEREFGRGSEASIHCFTRLTLDEFGQDAREARVRDRLER